MKTREEIIQDSIKAKESARKKREEDSNKAWRFKKYQILLKFPDAIPNDERRTFDLAGVEFTPFWDSSLGNYSLAINTSTLYLVHTMADLADELERWQKEKDYNSLSFFGKIKYWINWAIN